MGPFFLLRAEARPARTDASDVNAVHPQSLGSLQEKRKRKSSPIDAVGQRLWFYLKALGLEEPGELLGAAFLARHERLQNAPGFPFPDLGSVGHMLRRIAVGACHARALAETNGGHRL
ncbi:hypothetical protein THIX_20551 [Thiomonas sp. X19]|nr:hypothetical protein THIX_20551 [Thiomonas sp. X19]